MVVIKSTERPLSASDIWPGLPWKWEDSHRIEDECRQRAVDSGITKEPQLSFAAAREYEKYMRLFPRLAERQKIMSRIYPHKRTNFGIPLTEEEAQYLADRLFGANDEVGKNILRKIMLTLGSK